MTEKDARIEFVKEVQRLQEESNRLHLVAVTAKDDLMRETRKYDEHLAELERKLQEIDCNLDFEPDANHTIADMANVGYDLMEALRLCQPDYFYDNSPAEIVSDLTNDICDKDARIAELEAKLAHMSKLATPADYVVHENKCMKSKIAELEHVISVIEDSHIATRGLLKRKIEECDFLQRKLAEQQAITLTYYDHIGCMEESLAQILKTHGYSGMAEWATRLKMLRFGLDKTRDGELNNLLAKAKEEGRKEGMDRCFEICEQLHFEEPNEIGAGAACAGLILEEMLAAAPKLQGE